LLKRATLSTGISVLAPNSPTLYIDPATPAHNYFLWLAQGNRELMARAEAIESTQRVVLDMDSTEIPVYGQQEQSTYNKYYESTCYHPRLLFNGEGDCLAAKLRPGNVHSKSEVYAEMAGEPREAFPRDVKISH